MFLTPDQSIDVPALDRRPKLLKAMKLLTEKPTAFTKMRLNRERIEAQREFAAKREKQRAEGLKLLAQIEENHARPMTSRMIGGVLEWSS